MKRKEQSRVFCNEVKIIRSLESHRHIVGVHATYLTRRDFGILLDPVASDGDLEEFLAEYKRHKEDSTVADARTVAMTSTLERAFGCLAAGLAFIYEKRVRHKDIKSRNILVHNGVILYTDFGYSFDTNGLSRSTTEGPPDYFTRR
jgi:serine/threonine protein kinase